MVHLRRYITAKSAAIAATTPTIMLTTTIATVMAKLNEIKIQALATAATTTTTTAKTKEIN